MTLTSTDELERFRLDGQVAVVAGGSGGVGVRTCGALAAVGAKVAIIGRSEERLAEARSAVEAAGGEALVVAGDMARKTAADDAVAEVVDTLGRVDVLVNGIGGGAGTALHPAEDYPEADWNRILELNLTTALFVSQAAAHAMIAGGAGGSIVNISSVRGQLGIDAGYSAYVAAKGALDALTRQHATEWAKHNIRVNALSPTFVRTEQAAALLAAPGFYDNLVSRIPLRRIAETDDLMGALLFFCSGASSFVTGQVLTLDGGLTATQ
jgi:NAD(P)-dependent dehydrogenase (short-subunit alcohol dehydrogenase family)